MKKKSKNSPIKYGLCYLLFLLIASAANAQDSWDGAAYAASVAAHEIKAQRVIPPTPEAAELGKYGNIPISMFTGTPNISVPIYEIAGSMLHLPITMNYNSSGFKPQETPGWVGLGWSLSAGGIITRSVQGNPDVGFNYFNPVNYLTQRPGTVNNVFDTYAYMDTLQKGFLEGQPDTYYYNFAGINGKFFITPDADVVKKTKNNLLITPNAFDGLDHYSNNFTVVDENGVTYQFEDAEQATTQLDDGPGSVSPFHTYNYNSSWYLTTMTSADGQEQITFNYLTTGSPHIQYQDVLAAQSATYSITKPGTNDVYGLAINSATPPIVSTYRKYLKTINYSKSGVTTCKLVFDADTDARLDLDHRNFPGEQLLKHVKVYSFEKASEKIKLIKQFNFSYSYFGDTTAETDAAHKRLRLDKIQEVNTDSLSSAAKPPYVFTYNNDKVPAYGIGSIDSWGYSNGGEVTTLVPDVHSGTDILGLGANRNASLNNSLNTVMTRITYPTGGSTMFTYELNDAKDSNGDEIAIGGLRVKQSTDYSFDMQKATSKSFIYKLDDSTTSGQATMPGYVTTSVYNFYPELTLVHDSPPPQPSTTYYTTVSANPVNGLGTFQGSTIGYSQVISYLTDVNTGLPLGKTVTNYNAAISNGGDDDIGSGDMLKKRDFDSYGNLVEQQENVYSYGSTDGVPSFTVHNEAVQDNKKILCGYYNNDIFSQSWKLETDLLPACVQSAIYNNKLDYSGTYYQGQWKNLVAQTDKKFDAVTGSFVTEEKQFTYGNQLHTYPTIITERTGEKEWQVTNKKYAGDYVIDTAADDQSIAIKLLQADNMIGTEIESSQFLTDSISGKRYTHGVLKMYSPNQPYLSQLYQLETVQPLDTLSESVIDTDGTFSYSPYYKPWGSISYNRSGNIIEQGRTGAKPTAYVWDYDNMLPVAEVKGAGAGEVAYTSFETSAMGNWNIPSAARDTLVAATGKQSYDLVPGDPIVAELNADSDQRYIVSYWAMNGPLQVNADRLLIAPSTSGVTHSGWICYQHLIPAGTESVSLSAADAVNTIDELRLYPAGALMSTSTYEPLIGESSTASANNMLTHYKYDGLNRLTLVTDQDSAIVKQYLYNYGTANVTPAAAPQTLFYNSAQQQVFTKNSGLCADSSFADTATYRVAAPERS